MKTNAERLYWIFAAIYLLLATIYVATSAWEIHVGRIDGEIWRNLLLVPALWLFPSSLMLGIMLAELAFMPVSEVMLLGSDLGIAILALLTIAMAAWFYRSRRAPLKLRVAVLAGLTIFGVAVRVVVYLLITVWAFS